MEYSIAAMLVIVGSGKPQSDTIVHVIHFNALQICVIDSARNNKYILLLYYVKDGNTSFSNELKLC